MPLTVDRKHRGSSRNARENTSKHALPQVVVHGQKSVPEIMNNVPRFREKTLLCMVRKRTVNKLHERNQILEHSRRIYAKT